MDVRLGRLERASARAAPRFLQMGPFEWLAECKRLVTLRRRGCGDCSLGVPGSAPDLFPPERDPLCSNLTTGAARRAKPSFSSKPASPFMLGRLVRKLGLEKSGDRLNVWGSLSHHDLCCSVGLHRKLSAPTNQRAHSDQTPTSLLTWAVLTILLSDPRQSSNPGSPGQIQH